MKFQENLIEEIAKKMQEEIDCQLMFNLLVESGWTKIILPNKYLPTLGEDLHKWREENLKGAWKAHNNIWIFEKSEDAVIFSLRWS